MNFFRKQTTGARTTGDLENSAGNVSDTPLPSYDDAMATAQQTLLTVITERQQRRSAEDVSNLSPRAAAEADRLRRFLRYNLAVDYQEDCTTSVSTEDRAHFATLNTLLDDLASTQDTVVPNQAERTALAPYFWHVLHEPCIVLGIPIELAIDYVKRHFTYHGIRTNYKGSITYIPLREGLDRLAQKLVTDREIMIPKIIPELYMRMRFYEHLDARMKQFFSSVSGAESYTTLSRVPQTSPPRSAQWMVNTVVCYKLNENGARWANNREAAVEAGPGVTVAPLATWVQRAREGINMMTGRAGKPKARVAECFAPLCPGVGSKWVWKRTYYLPDMFSTMYRNGDAHG